jgi:hypothetical protein
MTGMSSEEGPVGWLRAQVEADLRMKRALLSSQSPFTRKDAKFRVADCEAKLAVIDLCEGQIARGERPEGRWSEGRDDDEIMRDEAVAELAEEVLDLMAEGYRHRDGWAEHWACPGCGKPIREVPLGHSWAIPLSGGPWTCSDLKSGPVSPEDFIAGR